VAARRHRTRTDGGGSSSFLIVIQQDKHWIIKHIYARALTEWTPIQINYTTALASKILGVLLLPAENLPATSSTTFLRYKRYNLIVGLVAQIVLLIIL
jgi:hypothetical protein